MRITATARQLSYLKTDYKTILVVEDKIMTEDTAQQADTFESHGVIDKYSNRRARIHSFLESELVGVLATVDPNGRPHATVIYYSVDSEFNIFFSTKDQTKKSGNLSHNNAAQLVVFDTPSQTLVQVYGTVSEIDEPFDRQLAFAGTIKAASLTSDNGVPPISRLMAGKYVAYKLTPTQVRMAVYARPDPGDYSKIFETLEAYELHPDS
jgi:nitroimidazol reductase NimA-like FMN-containing flavoprotein (pyridoxamine 5'-phosphate oxidase superfamily)